ncbi:hypothetical protein I5U65_02340 [Stenotrophomonas maltophilia]|nr:hypothetical protein [Stenotrophomonas maltophilia]
MTDFTFFSNGDQIWVISHIDGYVKPHKGTESTSVCCYLTSIPADFGDDPSKLSKSQIATIFARGESWLIHYNYLRRCPTQVSGGLRVSTCKMRGMQALTYCGLSGWMQDERVSVTAGQVAVSTGSLLQVAVQALTRGSMCRRGLLN